MAVPKKRTSSTKKKQRRAHDALKMTSDIWVCPECDKVMGFHRVCDRAFDCYGFKKRN